MTATLQQPPASSLSSISDVISAQLRSRLIASIVREHKVTTSYATRILDQALDFLLLCAKNPGSTFAPSPTVDIGWHVFILHTREYADFCQQVAGWFIHHVPNDEDDRGGDTSSVPRTVDALRSNGFRVDEPLWRINADERSHCENDDCRNGR